MTGKALDALFDQCHIAVGSLGIHRIGLKEASILKAREYCARGVPFIYGIPDPDFPPDHPENMRRYAEEHLDWSVKMKKLKDFLEALVGEDGTPEPGTDPTKKLIVPGGTTVTGASTVNTSPGSPEGR